MPYRIAVALSILLIACDLGPVAEDAGGDGGHSSGQIAAPSPPRDPSMACPDGWSTRDVAGVAACAPWIDPPACSDGEARFVGAPSCAPVGAACPVGELPEGLSGDVRYVAVGARAGAAGTRDDPFATVEEALAGAGAGTTVALGRGAHDVRFVELPAGVHLVGACASETALTSAHQEAGRALVSARAGATRLSNVTLRGDLLGVVAVGAELTLSGVIVDRPRSIGVLSLAGGRVLGADVVVRDVQTSGGSGGGIVANGGEIELTRVEVLRVPGAGVATEAMGGAIRVTDARFADALPGGLGAGLGVDVKAGSVTLERVLVEGGEQVGVKVGGAPSASLTLRDAVIRDVPSSAASGAGILVGVGAELVVERAWIANITGSGVQVQDSTASLTDLIVDGATRSGVLTHRSELTLNRALLVGGEAGVIVSDESAATITDLRVEDVEASEAMPYGPGALVVAGSTATVERLAIARTGSGVIVGTGSAASFTDLAVADPSARHDALLVGTGVVVADRATASLTRAEVSRARGVGIAVEGAGSRLDATEVRVLETLERACVTSCGAATFGSGVVATEGGHVTLTGFAVRTSALAGLRLLTGGTMDLTDGEVVGHPIGLDLQTAPFDATRVSASVVYLDNQRNVARSEVPPPDLTVPEI